MELYPHLSELDPEGLILKYANIQEMAKEYVADGSFILDFGEDNYSKMDILQVICELTLDDLDKFGLHINPESIITLTESSLNMYYVYNFVSCLHEQELLIQFMDKNLEEVETKAKEAVETQDIVPFLETCFSPHSCEVLNFVAPHIDHISDDFAEWVIFVINKVRFKTTEDKDLSAIHRRLWIDKVGRKIRTFRNNLAYIFDQFPLCKALQHNQEIAEAISNNYDKDKLDPRYIDKFIFFDKEVVHPELVRLKKEWHDKHHKSSPHHAEYWEYRPNMPFIYLIILAASELADLTQEDIAERRAACSLVVNTLVGVFKTTIVEYDPGMGTDDFNKLIDICKNWEGPVDNNQFVAGQ